MAARPNAPNVLIVGAGVVGAALAYELARRRQRVLVVDRAEGDGLGATRWSLGGTSWLGAAMDPRLRDLCREGLDRHQAMRAELGMDAGFHARPTLVLAATDEAFSGLVPLLENGLAHGFGGRLVERDELRQLERTLAPNAAVGAVRCDLGWLDTVTATRAWLQAAVRLGAEFRPGVEVQAIRSADSAPMVETTAGPLRAGQVVLAAGAWLGRLLRQSGIAAPLVHTHAEVMESEPLPPTFQHLIVTANQSRAVLEAEIARPENSARLQAEEGGPELAPVSVELGVVQRADGRVRLGQLSRAIAGFLDGPRPDGEALIRAEVARYFPDLARQPAGHHSRPVSFSPDRLPVAGPIAATPGCWLVSALNSPLIYLPALASRVAAALLGDPAPELAPFALERFTATRA